MTKIKLLRHGESTHNVVFAVEMRDPGFTDAPLTDLGKEQVNI